MTTPLGNMGVTTPGIGVWKSKYSLRPDDFAEMIGDLTFTSINGASFGAAMNRLGKTIVVPLVGATIQAGVVAWQNPEGADIIIRRAIVDRTTKSTGASTLDIGTTATDATTASDNLIDGMNSGAAEGLSDNINDAGTNGKARQKLASGKWVTIKSASGDTTGLVGTLYIEYILA